MSESGDHTLLDHVMSIWAEVKLAAAVVPMGAQGRDDVSGSSAKAARPST